ncbi:MAG TPA: diaminopimelate decarboxylase [Oscillospiraceae bacterium]|nr:diaminopimelate decarboxylase [Oscillospiraceae bacterium]
MYVSDCISVNKKGHLTIGGIDTVSLAKEYGTPLIVYDKDKIRENCRQFSYSMNEYYGNGLVLYAGKAFLCKEMCRIIMSEGLGLDVVSGGELYTAASVDFPMEKVVFHGNNKTKEEILEALKLKVGRFVVDNIEELYSLNSYAKKLGIKQKVLIRIKPGIDAHTHEFVKTGQIDSKFGFALETGEAFDAVEKCLSFENIELSGVHCHIGSQIFEFEPFCLAAEVMIDFMIKVKDELGITLKELNLGGGFGIKYSENDKPQKFSEYMKVVAKTVKEKTAKHGFPVPFVFIEPGRAVVGAECVTLYTIGSVKTIPNIRTYVAVDGGMGDNPRYILYQSKYEVVCANKALLPRIKTATIAGRCCESGDLIQENALVQDVKAGDVLAVLSTGAYNYSMASNYNRYPRPCVVMVSEGNAKVIIKRETYENIIENDI